MADRSRPAYAASGVDLAHNRRVKSGLRSAVESTATSLVLRGFGAFAGGLRLPDGYAEPVLLASTDSLGTKLHLAIQWGRPETAGRDLVNHCVNDLAVQNARPLAFLDYIAAERLEPSVVKGLVSGMAEACRAAGVALVGGETAQLPDTYRSGAYDVAGTILGIAERAALPDPSGVRAGDVCVGLPSTGPHSNGYGLARRVAAHLDPETRVGDQTLREALLAPHVSYLDQLKLAFGLAGVRAAAHITGGGLVENVPRVLPDGLAARLLKGAWPVPPIFNLIQEDQDVSEAEMWEVFNMGVGLVIVADRAAADALLRDLSDAFEAGEIVPRGVQGVELVDG